MPRHLVATVVLALLLAACGTDGTDAPQGDNGNGDDVALAAQVASFDLTVGEDRRLAVGVITQDLRLVAFGEVTFQLGYLGDQAGGQTTLTQEVTASFLPVPGMEPEGSADHPTPLEGTTGSGVYVGNVDLDQPGNWGVRVLAELEDGRVLETNTVFAVLAEPLVPSVGSAAPHTDNATIADVQAGTVTPVSVDSRAQGEDDEVPDAHLHTATVAGSLEAQRPVVVVVSTPVYCVSRFCGPLVEVISELGEQYADRADFVHLEVWEDFNASLPNDAALEWLGPPETAREPWVWLVDGDGTVLARWDNVLDVEALRAGLEALPRIEPLAVAAG